MFKHDGGSVVERVGAGCGWFNPGNSNGERTKKGARYAHGIDRGSQIVTEIRQCGLCGRTRSPDLSITFKDSGSKAGSRENDRSRKAIGA